MPPDAVVMDGGEDQMNSESDQSPLALFAALLSSQEGRQLFNDAVMHAVRTDIHKGPYNIDRLVYVASGVDAYKYAATNMRDVPRFATKRELLDLAIDNVTLDGPVVEFGVFSGDSINHIAERMPERRLFGFDSFEGLPEPWLGWPKGLFNRQGALPPVRDNVELVVGWFDRVLPGFLDQHDFKHVCFLHVDCDLHSSTQTVFAALHEKIVPGTIILFDEYMNYPGWERQEFLAFQQYVETKQRKYEYFGLVPNGEQVAVRILK